MVETGLRNIADSLLGKTAAVRNKEEILCLKITTITKEWQHLAEAFLQEQESIANSKQQLLALSTRKADLLFQRQALRVTAAALATNESTLRTKVKEYADMVTLRVASVNQQRAALRALAELRKNLASLAERENTLVSSAPQCIAASVSRAASVAQSEAKAYVDGLEQQLRPFSERCGAALQQRRQEKAKQGIACALVRENNNASQSALSTARSGLAFASPCAELEARVRCESFRLGVLKTTGKGYSAEIMRQIDASHTFRSTILVSHDDVRVKHTHILLRKINAGVVHHSMSKIVLALHTFEEAHRLVIEKRWEVELVPVLQGKAAAALHRVLRQEQTQRHEVVCDEATGWISVLEDVSRGCLTLEEQSSASSIRRFWLLVGATAAFFKEQEAAHLGISNIELAARFKLCQEKLSHHHSVERTFTVLQEELMRHKLRSASRYEGELKKRVAALLLDHAQGRNKILKSEDVHRMKLASILVNDEQSTWRAEYNRSESSIRFQHFQGFLASREAALRNSIDLEWNESTSILQAQAELLKAIPKKDRSLARNPCTPSRVSRKRRREAQDLEDSGVFATPGRGTQPNSQQSQRSSKSAMKRQATPRHLFPAVVDSQPLIAGSPSAWKRKSFLKPHEGSQSINQDDIFNFDI